MQNNLDQNIQNFLKAINQKDTYVEDLTTFSKHKLSAIKILNELCYEHPEWVPAILALSKYTKQKWAFDQTINKKYNIQVYFNNKKELIKKYPGTVEILEIINQAIYDEYFLREDHLKIFKSRQEFEAFEAIHDLSCDDVSRFIIANHYKNSVISFCEKYGDTIAKKVKKVKKGVLLLKEEEGSVYHDTDLLLKTIRAINRKEKELIHLNINEMNDLVEQCISIIANYPQKGYTYASIIQMYVLEGKSDIKIAKQKCLSETFVRQKRMEATELISLLLWGYFSKEMLDIYTIKI